MRLACALSDFYWKRHLLADHAILQLSHSAGITQEVYCLVNVPRSLPLLDLVSGQERSSPSKLKSNDVSKRIAMSIQSVTSCSSFDCETVSESQGSVDAVAMSDISEFAQYIGVLVDFGDSAVGRSGRGWLNAPDSRTGLSLVLRQSGTGIQNWRIWPDSLYILDMPTRRGGKRRSEGLLLPR
jgi:hypothetical protein